MEIRYITKDEAVDYLKVSAASFIWKFNKEVDTAVDIPVLAAFHEGKLIAGVEMYNYRTNYCGNFIDSLVVSGVCSIPEYRRMGGIRAIFDHIGKNAVESNWHMGFLQPFSITYYEKFGYANLNRMFAIKIPFENMSHIPRNTDMILYTGAQFEELSNLHRECALTENLVTLRDDRKHFCETPLEEADYTYFRRDKNGKADGYVKFTVKRPDYVKIEDLFFLTPEALYGILGFLRNYDCITKYILARKQYSGSPLSVIADRIHGISYEYDNGVAGRIYNLKNILLNNSYPQEYGRFKLLCNDSLSQNNGVFEVEYEHGKADVRFSNSTAYDISVTAPAAARLILAGEGHTKETAAFIDGVKINGNSEDFFRAFPHRYTRFSDSMWSE